MELVKVVPEDLLDKFRSKRDLYVMLTIDRRFNLLSSINSPLLLTTN